MGAMFEERNWWEPGADINIMAEDMSYWGQQAAQRIIDSTVWMGAYNEAISEGLTDAEAVNQADSVIRQTHVSGRAFDIATIQTSRWLNFFQMFIGFFNGMYNIFASDLNIIMSSDKAKGEKAIASAALYMNVVFIPATVSFLLKQVLSGKDWDRDGDDDIYDDLAFGILQANASYMAAFIPVFGPAAMAGLNRGFGDVRSQDRAQMSPAVDAVSASIGLATKAMKGDYNLKEITTVAGILTGLPIGFLGRPLNYIEKYSEGEANPSGPVDAARGLVTGQPGE